MRRPPSESRQSSFCPKGNGSSNGLRFLLLALVMTLLSADLIAGTQEQLAAYRDQIDSIDQRIVQLIRHRAQVVEEVGNIKRKAHLPVTVPNREQQVIEKAQAFAKEGPLPAEAVARIYQKLVEEMRNWETNLDSVAPQSSSHRQRGAATHKEAPCLTEASAAN